MSRRDYTYLTLALWVFFGGIVDSFIFAQQGSQSFGLIDIVHIFAIVLLTWWWCSTDADENGYQRPGSGIRLLIVLFSPIGLAAYLFKSRPLARAAVVLVAFYAGVLAAMLAGIVFGDFLVPLMSM